MWRFKPSKFKNATPKVPKKGDGWILDINVGSPYSHGNLIKASSAFMAFNIDTGGGGNLGVLPIDTVGSQSKQLPILSAHSELITDFDFCPYDDGIIATGSQDRHVKIWRIPEDGISKNSICNPEADLLADSRIEVLTFHPVADCLLTTADNKCIRLWDVCAQKQLYVDSSHDDVIQSINWKADGTLLASCGKDKKLRIWDPRNPAKSMVTHSHSNNRDVRVVWAGNSNQVITSGFGSGREREVLLRDIRNIGEPLATYSGHSSMGVFIPLFDEDTNMLFLVSKADTTIVFCEILDKTPHILEASKFVGDVQVKGAALVPKRAMNVMEGEVNRLLVLGTDCIVPISYQVPRKSYRDFHADLFPDTRAPEPALTSQCWQANDNFKIKTTSLDPSKRSSKSLKKFHYVLGSADCKGSIKDVIIDSSEVITENELQEAKLSEENASVTPPLVQLEQSVDTTNNQSTVSGPTPSTKPLPPPKKPVLVSKPSSTPQTSQLMNGSDNCSSAASQKQEAPGKLCLDMFEVPSNASLPQGQQQKPDSSPSPRRPVRTFGMRVSKFRHLNGTVLPKETHITVLSSLTRTIPGESDGFCANVENVAVPLGVAGGLVAVLKLSNTGRAPALADVPGVVCGTAVMDFAWDPFDPHRLVTVCDTGDILVWDVQNLCDKISEPSGIIRGHAEKASIIKFNPCARDIICTASNDLSVRIWDLASKEEKFSLEGHTDQILSVGWSLDGKFLATVCKDQKVRIYNPRVSSSPIQEGAGPQGTRGARVVWVLGDTHLVVSGFSKVSERQVYLYDVTNLSSTLGVCGLDVSPATLIPFYDEGSSTLFLTGKGDSTVFAYEVATDSPYFHPLSHYKCSGTHQALSFLQKCVCSIKEVEFARAIRLTTSSIEPMSFTVPRLRSEYFQDDLFPAARVTWTPTVSNSDWLNCVNYNPIFISLQPTDMTPLSEAPPPTKSTGPSPSPASNKSDIVFEGELVLEGSLSFMQNSKQKEEMIVQSMMSQCHFQQNSLPQESFEGVDPEEWDEDET